ncbi:MAG: phosphate transport system regulatory protein PhoU [Betaproteobacteria bacterium RBG_19FT_COMBO_58_11]|nr:MAG: phosphate transport system regulatory protein PhoU [Betaproteobacteria bacterium RBG_19FT_COMBO_58_11]
MPEHISKQFDQELEAVRARVLQMGGLVEEQIINAMEALASGNVELANTVMANDHRVNALEVALDEECSMIIARRQPTARDLRMLLTVIKTITDLERIGDEASKVARMAKLIYETDRIVSPRFTEIKHMTSIVLDMLRKALDGFARLEASNATQIARLDESVDEEYRMVLRHLVTYMMEDPRSISMFIEIIFAAKAIERMGDHAKNMSEYVVYMVKGKDVRHTSVEEIEKEVSR